MRKKEAHSKKGVVKSFMNAGTHEERPRLNVTFKGKGIFLIETCLAYDEIILR